MKLSELIIRDLTVGWEKYEQIIFTTEFLLILILSISMNDSKIALVSTICGIMFTILAGKGKVSCYFWGVIGTLCYAYISFKNGLYGNVGLYALYFLPMQFLGIYTWKKHVKEKTYEIVKTQLTQKERINYFFGAVFFCVMCYFALVNIGDKNPLFDSITSILSVFGLILTVKRCIEQWYIWIFVNGLATLMWIDAYINGSNCFATIIMWFTYFVLGFYFLYKWKVEIEDEQTL